MIIELQDSGRSHEKICSYKMVDIVILQISTQLKTTLSMTRIRICVALSKKHALWNLGFRPDTLAEGFHRPAVRALI